MNIKHSFCAILSAMLIASIFNPLAAQAAPPPKPIPTTPGDRDAVIELNTEALTFDVTVPTSLPIHVSASGEVTTADDVKIVNNSHGAVTVSNVTLNSHGDWSAVDVGEDLSNVSVGTKQYSMTINNETTTEAGTITFDQENWPSIYAINDSDTDELPITYSAMIAPQADTINTDVAEVVFTIGWDLAEPVVLTDYYTFTDDPETGGWKVSLTSDFERALYEYSSMGVGTTQDPFGVWYPGNPLPALPSVYEGKPVTNLSTMFCLDDPYDDFMQLGGPAFGDLDLSNFDFSNVVKMDGMFASAYAKSIDLSSLDISDKDIEFYFLYKGCSGTIYVKDAVAQEKLEEAYPDITFEIKSVD